MSPFVVEDELDVAEHAAARRRGRARDVLDRVVHGAVSWMITTFAVSM
jgi:hypothetical protein